MLKNTPLWYFEGDEREEEGYSHAQSMDATKATHHRQRSPLQESSSVTTVDSCTVHQIRSSNKRPRPGDGRVHTGRSLSVALAGIGTPPAHTGAGVGCQARPGTGPRLTNAVT